ncbi:MAG: acyl-CoA dehydrogenase family protein [Actinomycetota bacterium]|nr:acyl-CoA dehydrogenase family protein [Actinomycetota bacterium]
MDFSQVELTADQQAFEKEIRDLLSTSWTPNYAHIALDHDRSPEQVRLAMAKRGWVHPELAQGEGGAGLGEIEQEIITALFEEFYIANNANNSLLIPTLEQHGSAWLKENILPGIRTGELTTCLGYSEPDNGSDIAAAKTRAVQDGDVWIINGQKMWTTWGNESDYVFLLARTGPIEEKHRTLTMFLVPMDVPGVEATPVWILGGGRTNVTFYSDVTISDNYRIGPVNEGWGVMSTPLATEHGAGVTTEGVVPINGGMGAGFSRTFEKLIDGAIDWASSRKSADGRSRLEDPLVRIALAEALLDLEVCWNAEGELGKPMAAEALAANADRLADMAAPEGILDFGVDGSIAAGIIASERQHAPGSAIYGGTTEIYRNNLARRLGLPRPY